MGKKMLMKSGIKPNTFIGGVGATINTPALLATKLGIAVSRIKAFSVVGLDVQCAIVGTYSIPFNAFFGNTQLNKYIDLDGLVTTIGNSAFNGCTSLVGDLVFNSLIDLGNAAFFGTKITGFTANNVATIQTHAFYNCTALAQIYIINVGLIGTSNTALNNVFLNIKTGCTIKVPVAMQTINAGGVEPDLQYAITSRGATIIYT